MHKRKNVLFTSKGFSLIQVLISISLLSGLALLYSQMTKKGIKSAKTVESTMETYVTLNHMRRLLGKNENCMATINQEELVAIKVKQSQDEIKDMFPAGKVINTSGLKVSNYKITGLLTEEEQENLDSEDLNSNIENNPYATLHVTFESGKIVNKAPITKQIALNIIYDDYKNIESCYAIGFNDPQKIDVVEADDSGRSEETNCYRTGKMRYNKKFKTMQICGDDHTWYNVLIGCTRGAVRTCPSNESIQATCSSDLGIWTNQSGENCPEW